MITRDEIESCQRFWRRIQGALALMRFASYEERSRWLHYAIFDFEALLRYRRPPRRCE